MGRPGGRWASVFEELAVQVAEAPPMRPNPLTHENLLNLFKGDVVGRNVVLQPATMDDMWVEAAPVKKSLEVIYEGAA
jgi:chlorophyllide a reductase subunit X